ncbi:MAG: B12-binding domain-containing radical SAM protein [Candidatus Omnitrophica bacterium]|nr:B12-binding domain-containing radical SAM protein [Candidatus Omnitrophota bacterium]
MGILVINPPMMVNRKPTFPSFGIDFIVQALQQGGFQPELLDIDAYRYSREHVCDVIRRSPADVIAIGGLVMVYPYVAWLVPEIRRIKPSCAIILGGPLASSLKGVCFERLDIDFIVIGEGEVTIVELLKEISGKRDFAQVLGIGYRHQGKAVFTAHRPFLASLDQVPRFDDTRFPMDQMLQSTNGVFQIHVQRGCPSSCTFCFNAFRVVGKNVRYRPAVKVVEDMVYFQKKYGAKIKLFALTGECITMSKEWVREFSGALISSGLKIKYRVTSRVDTIDEDRLKWLKDSGCYAISFGIESGSEKLLKIMKKNATPEKSLRAVHLTKKYFDHIQPSMILGYVGEDQITLRDTVEFSKRLGVKPLLCHATAFPGTELYEMAKQLGRIKDEGAYLMDLDKSSILDKGLNLTEMPDDEARQAIADATREIENFYFWYDLVHLKFIDYIVFTFQAEGMGVLMAKIAKRFRALFLKGGQA